MAGRVGCAVIEWFGGAWCAHPGGRGSLARMPRMRSQYMQILPHRGNMRRYRVHAAHALAALRRAAAARRARPRARHQPLGAPARRAALCPGSLPSCTHARRASTVAARPRDHLRPRDPFTIYLVTFKFALLTVDLHVSHRVHRRVLSRLSRSRSEVADRPVSALHHPVLDLKHHPDNRLDPGARPPRPGQQGIARAGAGR